MGEPPRRWARRLSNVIGFDDEPHTRGTTGRVGLIGCVCSGPRLDIVVRGTVDKDGDDATDAMASLVRDKALVHVRAVMLQGITFAGFNVVDIHALARGLGLPVLVVMRRRPRLDLVAKALARLPGSAHKQALLDTAGPVEPCGEVYVQRSGLTLEEAARMLARTTEHGVIPEPLRLAHIIAGGTTTGRSRGRA